MNKQVKVYSKCTLYNKACTIPLTCPGESLGIRLSHTYRAHSSVVMLTEAEDSSREGGSELGKNKGEDGGVLMRGSSP